MEIFPAPGIERKLEVLEPNAYVAVTCSPTKGLDATIDLTETLVHKGFRVVPHLAAKNVRDRDHLGKVVSRLDMLGVESIFVPGGDAAKPAGEFATAAEVLQALGEFEHGFRDIGVAAHPEGHPDVDDRTLLSALLEKQRLATYMVTQMCFDADVFGSWLRDMRHHGVTLPVWIGLPGVVERSHLLATSLRIGVGDSMRFLRRSPKAAAELIKSSVYAPDDLVLGLAKYQADYANRIDGYHLFCFNQVARTETWRHETIAALTKTTTRNREDQRIEN